MSDTNVIIGIGGTGAKIIEAFTHVCASGLGPDAAHVGLVDQDRANGNTSAARDSLSEYIAARNVLRRDNDDNVLASSCVFMATRLRAIAAGADVWSPKDIEDAWWVPHRDEGETLATMFGAHGFGDEETALSRALFRHGPDEWDLNQSEGYQARPHIGAAALLNADGGAFWESLDEIVRSAATQSVRVFIAGSVFGGTGAAGFPTLARKIRKLAEEHRVEKGVMVSGVLMTPYFRFGSPKDATDTALRSEELMYQAQIALDYYHDLFRRESVFDTLYLLGWNRFFHLPYYSRGKQAQRNPPLMPELYAALAAAETFSGAFKSKSGAASIFGVAGEEDQVIAWGDLPDKISGPGDRRIYPSLSRWMRFNFAWRYLYRPELDSEARRIFGIGHSRWFRAHCSTIDFKSPDLTDDFKRIDAWTDRSLSWAAALSYWSGRQSQNEFRLWNDFYAEHDAESPTAPPKLKPTSVDFGALFDTLIHQSKTEDAPVHAEPLFQRVAAASPREDSKGVGRLIHAIFDQADLVIRDAEADQ